MKKSHQIITIGVILGIFIAVAIWVYLAEGADMRNSHYIRLELNPKIEFLTDSDNKVNTIYPINDEAKIIVAGEDFEGLSIENAVTKYLDLCVKMGYLKVDSEDNAIQLSVSSSFTQSLENRIYRTCNNFFLENEILCVIAESDADLALFREKNDKQVSSIEKLVVIKSILEKYDTYSFEELNAMTESELINLLEKIHDYYKDNIGFDYQENIDRKNLKLEENKDKYLSHIASISNETQREFSQKYTKYKKQKTYDYELDFAKKLRENQNI